MDDAPPDDVGLPENSNRAVRPPVINREIDRIPDLPVEAPAREHDMIDLTETDDEDDEIEIIGGGEDQEVDEGDEIVDDEDEIIDEGSGSVVSNEEDDARNVFFGNQDEQEAVAAQLRADQERLEQQERCRQQEEENELIVEGDVVNSEEEKREIRNSGVEELLNWFLCLKAEHFSKFQVAGNDYYTTYSTKEPFLDMERCKQIAIDYKESNSLEGLAEKWELANRDLLIAAIIIAVLDDDNELDINFNEICIDRIDEWSFKKCYIFFEKQGKTNFNKEKTPISPLKFMQFTATSPAFAFVLLTITRLLDNGRPCNFDPESEQLTSDLLNIDPFELSNNIIDTSAKYWNLEKDRGTSSSQMNKALDDFFHEIEATTAEVREHHEATVNREKALFELTKEKITVYDDDEIRDLTFLPQDQREKLIKARAEMESLREELKMVTDEASVVYNRKSELAKKLILIPGDYCLARAVESDEQELTYAVVQGIVNDKTYRVKFVNSNQERSVHIRDLAMTTLMVHDPALAADVDTGFRVAVRQTSNISANSVRSVWVTGTTAGRTHSHKGDFLVFLDNGHDVYVSVPMKQEHKNWKVATMRSTQRPLSYQDVMRKMTASSMAVMVAQPLRRQDGHFEKVLSYLYIRSHTRAHFVKEFMTDYPEWQLYKMPIGTKSTILSPGYSERGKRMVTVVGHDRAFAIVRHQMTPGMPGFDCFVWPCNNEKHNHRDERIYRGSHRIEGAAAMKRILVADNNLSVRRKTQIASQFEPTGMARQMPQRSNMIPGIMKKPTSSPQVVVASGGGGMSSREIEERKRRQILLNKTIVQTPVLPPREELPYHTECGPDCLRKMDKDPCEKEFYSNSPLHTPMLCGWRRSKYTLHTGKKRSPFKKVIVYFGPCGKPLSGMAAVSQYLQDTRSKLSIDCFSFEDYLNTETYVTVEKEYIKLDDFAEGYEGIPIPLVNSVDSDPAPQFQYCKRRFAYDNSVHLPTINRDFCSGCSCEGDCTDPEKCECMQLSAKAVAKLPDPLQYDYDNKEKITPHYNYRNLKGKVITGVYECNDQCPCNRNTCHNRVVQNNIKYPLQIFKTAESGWGCRALTDIPEGAFICTYVGALLTNDLANKLEDDDQYFADLDLQDSVEEAKEGFVDNDTDFGYGGEEEDDDEDDYVADGADDSGNDEDKPFVSRDDSSETIRTTRKSTRQNKKRTESTNESSSSRGDGNGKKKGKKEGEGDPKDKEGVFKWDQYFENSLYVVDAKVRGNLGRFLNHSCNPNVEVQHVLYDTHDLRLPWVAFFSTRHVEAGDELAWDYRYALDSGKVRINCKCGAKNCRRRLL